MVYDLICLLCTIMWFIRGFFFFNVNGRSGMSNNNKESIAKKLYNNDVMRDIINRLKSSKFECKGVVREGDADQLRLCRHDSSTGRTTTIDLGLINGDDGEPKVKVGVITHELVTGCRVHVCNNCVLSAVECMETIRELMRETIRYFSQPRDHLIMLNEMKM